MNEKTKKLIGDDKVLHYYETYDYDKFTPVKYQREADRKRIEDLKLSFEVRYALTIIIVNKYFGVGDGWGRVCTLKEEGLPVRYAIDYEAEDSDVWLFNSYNKKWSNVELVSMFAGMGKEHYIAYSEFRETYGLNHSSTLAMLNQECSWNKSTELFKQGKFKVINIEKAHLTAQHAKDFGTSYPNIYKKSQFHYALINIMNQKNYSIDKMKKRIGSREILNSNSSKLYQKNLIELYTNKTVEFNLSIN